MNTLFETGASSHSVNDLILFTDSTEELAELRDYIYKNYPNNLSYELFNRLFNTAVKLYIEEFPNKEDHKHILEMSIPEQEEYVTLYITEYKNWIEENQVKNTYSKYCPNVFLAKCPNKHEKGTTILVTTKYGKENECIVFNLIYEKEGFYYYSIVRADGFNVQEWAKRKADRLQKASINADSKSRKYHEASNEGKDFLSLAEPIKIGHHSEKRHRALIERNQKSMKKSVEFSKKSEEYESRAEYWESKASQINLSMPESLEYYEFELEKAKVKHDGLKNGTIKRSHSFSLTYAKKEVNELEKKIKVAQKLWA